MNKKLALCIIDGQNDFMDIQGAALPVQGASADMDRLSSWAIPNIEKFSRIFLTQDSHHYLDIAHPDWWQDASGKTVSPFTLITYADIMAGKYTPRLNYKKSVAYVKALEDNGEYLHFIWPPHCLMGTWGHNFYKSVFDIILATEKSGKWVNIITKGSNPFTEHFGAFRANIEDPNDWSTQLDQNLINNLLDCDEVLIAGEARSHCVANSLRQLLQEMPALAPKLVVLTDCMSDVPGLPQAFYDEVQKLYDDAKNKGVKFETTQTYKF